MDQGRHGERSDLSRRITLFLAYGFSLATTYLLLQPGATTSESTPLGDFRGYFAFDQLTYAGIASNAASGNFTLVEPFTETGISYYPSLWYLLLGLIAGISGLGVPAVWTILGAGVIALAVMVVGFAAYRMSGQTWAPALVGPALWIGPIALAVGDEWYLPLQSHAVLWGPYGELFSLNAEAVGISIGATALMVLLIVSARSPRKPRSLLAVAVAGLLIGLLANVHTYSFFVTLGFVASWLSIVGIGLSSANRRFVLTGISLAIVVAVTIAGTFMGALRESLAIFALMMLAALPGAIQVAWRVPQYATVGLLSLAVAASPQIIQVLRGISANDPFLAYRQVQSADLGIGIGPFILATLPIALWVLAITLGARWARLPLPLSSSAAAGLVALTILSFNDLWGFVQEPYRMWIASLTLTALVAVPLTAKVLAIGADAWSHKSLRVLAAFSIALVALSWWNLGGFRSFVNELQPISFDSSRLSALGLLTSGQGGLLASDPCVDPLHLKIVSRERVAFYSPGLAWPANREVLDHVIDNRSQNILDTESMRRAGVIFLVTDSSCPANWEIDAGSKLILAGEQPYASEGASGILRLWLLQ